MKIAQFFIKSLLFFSSYIPLWIILGIKFYPTIKLKGAIIVIGIIMFSFLILYGVIFYKRGGKKRDKKPKKLIVVESCENITSSYLEYLITYIIPFTQIDLNLYSCLSLIILFIFVWWLYINSNLIYVNPTLKFMGYNIYKVKDRISGREYILLTKKEKIMIGEEIGGSSFYSDDILLDWWDDE